MTEPTSLAASTGPAQIVPTPSVPRKAQALIGVLLVAVVSLAAVVITPSSSVPSTPPGAGETAHPVTPTGNTTHVTVKVDGMSYAPNTIEVPAGETLVITFENTGDQHHDLVLANGARTESIAPGDTAVLDAGVMGASMVGWCSLPGHRAMGMELSIIVNNADIQPGTEPDPPHQPGGHGTSGDEPDLAAPSMVALLDQARAVPAMPAELPPLSDSTRHEFVFTVTESTEDVAEGVSRAVWTYNGSSPGPTLHGRVGDTFIITLINEGTMGHSIDFHAGELAPDEPMRTLEPGEQLTYTFTAQRSGVWMYHCSTMPMSQHIANGMFGAVVIEPPGLEPVDRSYVLVQSEMYLGADGAPTSPHKAAIGVPDVMAFNGRAFQYSAHPLQARAGERVRFWVLNAGPNQSLSFHVVGTQFDTVWTEGAYSVYRGASTDGITQGVTGAQVLTLLAAQGGFVELVPPEPGHYPFVNHQMSFAEKGASGMLEVTG